MKMIMNLCKQDRLDAWGVYLHHTYWNLHHLMLNLHARTLGTTINETVQTAGVESILAIIYTVANGKDRVYFGPAAR